MWLVRTSVIVCVPQWGSSDGGSPRLPILRTPPFFCASASSGRPASTRTARMESRTARDRTFSRCIVRLLSEGPQFTITGPPRSARVLLAEALLPAEVVDHVREAAVGAGRHHVVGRPQDAGQPTLHRPALGAPRRRPAGEGGHVAVAALQQGGRG